MDLHSIIVCFECLHGVKEHKVSRSLLTCYSTGELFWYKTYGDILLGSQIILFNRAGMRKIYYICLHVLQLASDFIDRLLV